MKDFYDILLISKLPEYDPKDVKPVVKSVFKHRSTQLPYELVYDSQALANFAQNWKRFRTPLEEEFKKALPSEFSEVLKQLNEIIAILHRSA